MLDRFRWVEIVQSLVRISKKTQGGVLTVILPALTEIKENEEIKKLMSKN